MPQDKERDRVAAVAEYIGRDAEGKTEGESPERAVTREGNTASGTVLTVGEALVQGDLDDEHQRERIIEVLQHNSDENFSVERAHFADIVGFTPAPWDDNVAIAFNAEESLLIVDGKRLVAPFRLLSEENFQLAVRCVNLISKNHNVLRMEDPTQKDADAQGSP